MTTLGSVAGGPVAWAVVDSRGTVCVAYTCREAAEAYCEGTFNRMAPLYRQPQPAITDAEREAIECGIQAIGLAPCDERTLAYADALRGLLERAGGDR